MNEKGCSLSEGILFVHAREMKFCLNMSNHVELYQNISPPETCRVEKKKKKILFFLFSIENKRKKWQNSNKSFLEFQCFVRIRSKVVWR